MNHSFLEKNESPGNALQLDLLIDAQKIKERLIYMVKEFESLYDGEELTFFVIMKGAFFLVSDLMRALNLPSRIEFITCTSTGMGGTHKGELQFFGLETLDIEGKHILLVDDIFDTGDKLSEIYKEISRKHPLSLRSLVLLTKDVPHNTDYRPDFSLFDIEDRFVVGYGLDYKEYYRGLSSIYAIHP